jgi:hypothetical protein
VGKMQEVVPLAYPHSLYPLALRRLQTLRTSHPLVRVYITLSDASLVLAEVDKTSPMKLRLTMRGKPTGLEDVPILSRLLLTSNRIVVLCLGGEWFGDGQAVELAACLGLTHSLAQLRLSDCSSLGTIGLELITSSLKGNTTIERLSLDNLGRGCGMALHLAELLGSSGTPLQRLSIARCDFRVGDICRALAANNAGRRLREFNIGYCKIGGDAGALALAGALSGPRANTSLEALQLEGCGVTYVGVTAIAQSLETNTSLKRLKICRTHDSMERASFRALAAALCKTRTLALLDVGKIGSGRPLEGVEEELGRAWGSNLDLPLEPGLVATNCLLVTYLIKLHARDVREFVLRRRDLFLALGLALHPRHGGRRGQGAFADAATRNHLQGRPRRGPCAFHGLCDEIFRLIWEAYGDPPKNFEHRI